MKVTRVTWQLVCCWVAVLGVQAVAAQEPAKPGPEHALLKEMEGEWEAHIKAMGMESKGSMVYKLMQGGLWVTYDFKGDFGGMPFTGHGIMGYDAAKKKYFSVWVDSMSGSPMISEGTYDAAKKVFTEVGEAMGPSGKMEKMKMVTEIKSRDEMVFTMNTNDQPMMTIVYKRKK